MTNDILTSKNQYDTFWPMRKNGIENGGLKPVTPEQVAGMGPKAKARLEGIVSSLRRAQRTDVRRKPDVVLPVVVSDYEVPDVLPEPISAFPIGQEVTVFDPQKVSSVLGDAVRAEPSVKDPYFKEESLRAVGANGIVAGDDALLSCVDGLPVSLEGLIEAEEYEQAQELFDYGITARDLRE